MTATVRVSDSEKTARNHPGDFVEQGEGSSSSVFEEEEGDDDDDLTVLYERSLEDSLRGRRGMNRYVGCMICNRG